MKIDFPLTLTLSPRGEGDRLLPLPSGERIEVRGMGLNINLK
jgi:hypothetical protein